MSQLELVARPLRRDASRLVVPLLILPGLAFALSQAVGLALYLISLRRHELLAGALALRHLQFRPDWAWRILRIGLPAALQAVIRTLGMMSFTGMLAHTLEGASGVAAMQIGIRAESIAFMPGFGYSVAASAVEFAAIVQSTF